MHEVEELRKSVNYWRDKACSMGSKVPLVALETINLRQAVRDLALTLKAIEKSSDDEWAYGEAKNALTKHYEIIEKCKLKN